MQRVLPSAAISYTPIPRQNRVTPFGEIIATPARGTLMGNRGSLHDSQGTIRRAYAGKRWIICLLEFKNRQRMIMTPGQYTELFFLDEATALAAGHRPCAECQRERFTHFRALWAAANPQLAHKATPTAGTVDAVLHAERLSTVQRPLLSLRETAQLPNGTFVAPVGEETAYLVLQSRLLRWSPFVYQKVSAAFVGTFVDTEVRLLTPPSLVRTLAEGFVAGLHASEESSAAIKMCH
ncbi:MAG: hypothetical protein R3E79_35055 [Caldilineaceae bacterium]